MYRAGSIVIETIPKFDYQKTFQSQHVDSFWANGGTGSKENSNTYTLLITH
jgi:hypothetical protein